VHNYDAELSLDVTLRRGSYPPMGKTLQILEGIKQDVAVSPVNRSGVHTE
jgi:hypothetical protein